MNILVDTSVWSLAFRKKTLTLEETKIVSELKELIYEKRVIMIGPIRQELLSGIKNKKIFDQLCSKIKVFEDVSIETEDYEKAAEINDVCRSNGIQGSHIDFLIAATAMKRNIAIFTIDKDFQNYSKIVEIKLHKIRNDIEE